MSSHSYGAVLGGSRLIQFTLSAMFAPSVLGFAQATLVLVLKQIKLICMHNSHACIKMAQL